VELITLSPHSIQPAGTIRISPSGVKVKRRKNDRIVSSWNILKDFVFISDGLSVAVVTGCGKDIFDMLCIHFSLLRLKILQDLKWNENLGWDVHICNFRCT